jgi:hypothetical protein
MKGRLVPSHQPGKASVPAPGNAWQSHSAAGPHGQYVLGSDLRSGTDQLIIDHVINDANRGIQLPPSSEG